MSLPGPFSVVQGQLNELQANESPKPLPHFIQGQLNGLQATSPCTSIADNLDVGREEERVEASGHGLKAFLEWHTLSLHSWMGKRCFASNVSLSEMKLPWFAFPKSYNNKWKSVRTGSSS